MVVNRDEGNNPSNLIDEHELHENQMLDDNEEPNQDEAEADYEDEYETNDDGLESYSNETNEDVSSMLSSVGRYNLPVTVVPNAPEGVVPVVGSLFQSVGHCIDMYDKYAEHCGFDIRLATEKKYPDKTTKLKYLLCHKAGLPNKKKVDSTHDKNNRKSLRNSNFKVTGCDAQVRFRKVAGTNLFKLYYFNDTHNHPMYDKYERILSRNRRRLRFSDKRFIQRAARANIGAAKAHQLQVCLKGGYEEVGSSRTDYKNFKRDLDSFVGDGDVQMVLNMFNERI